MDDVPTWTQIGVLTTLAGLIGASTWGFMRWVDSKLTGMRSELAGMRSDVITELERRDTIATIFKGDTTVKLERVEADLAAYKVEVQRELRKVVVAELTATERRFTETVNGLRSDVHGLREDFREMNGQLTSLLRSLAHATGSRA